LSRRLDIPVTTIAVDTRLHWEAYQRARAPYQSAQIVFTMNIDLGGGVSPADKKRLVAAAGVFYQTVAEARPHQHRLKIGEDWVLGVTDKEKTP
jgi:uncharacterized SAM-binding protein YcdF (DUF218 family)